MKLKSFAIVFFLISFALNYAQESNQKSVSVTVYNQNLGVIKDVREMNIKQGVSSISLADVAQQIDPTSVHISFSGEVLEQNYQYDLVSLDKILKKYIDREIQLISIEEKDLIEGMLLSSYGSQAVLKKSDGGLIMIPNVNLYTISVASLPEGLITKPTLLWTVNSKGGGKQNVEVTYQTRGMNWHAEYVAVLNENDAALDLNSWVSVENTSGASFRNAKLKLVAGDINLVSTQPPYVNGMRKDAAFQAAEQFQEKEFFEYHIYNLQRPTTISNNETKQISLFEAPNVKSQKKYFYGSRGYYDGSTRGKVAVIVEFDNNKSSGLGVPMPKGKVRVYKSDGESVEFIGEDLIDHTPNKEKVKLKIGEAFDIVVEDVQTDSKRITDRINEQTWEVKFKNRKSENVVIDVERLLGLNWEIRSSNFEYTKKDAQRIAYSIPVKADDETILKYTVRYSY